MKKQNARPNVSATVGQMQATCTEGRLPFTAEQSVRSNRSEAVEKVQTPPAEQQSTGVSASMTADKAQTIGANASITCAKGQNASYKELITADKDQIACGGQQTTPTVKQNADINASMTIHKEQETCIKAQIVSAKEQSNRAKASMIASAKQIVHIEEPMISCGVHMTSIREQKTLKKGRLHSANLPAAGLVALLLLLWQVIAMRLDAAYILPSPTQILARLWALREPLLRVHLPATMLVTAVGLFISIGLGLLLAIAMDASPLAEKAFYPIIIASQTIPTTAIAPLFVLWFGYGIWSKVLVTVLITFFPITISMFDGFRSVKTEMEELLFTYGAGRRDIFIKLKLPAALPYFFSAIKMAVPLSIIGAAIGEWLGAQSGLGYFSRRMMTQLDGAGVFAPIVLLSAVAMLIVGLISLLERAVIRWRKEL